MTSNERNSCSNHNTARSERPFPLPYFDTPAMVFPPHEIQSYFGTMDSALINNPPHITSKRLTIQIGCQHPILAENNDGSEGAGKKRFPKMLKAISDQNLTVEGWLYEILSRDICNEQLVNLFEDQNIIFTAGNDTTTTLTLSLGPTQSMQIEVAKDSNGIKCDKKPSKEDKHVNKRRRESTPKSLKMQLVTSKSDVVLCPRDPIFQLIDSPEELTLRSAGEGSWESQEIVCTNEGDGNIDAPIPVETESLREESPPAKRPKLQKLPNENEDDDTIGSNSNDDDKKEEKKSKKYLSYNPKTTRNLKTRSKQEKPIIDEQKKEKSSPGFSDRDVLFGFGTEQRQNPGNEIYKERIKSKLPEYSDSLNRERICNELKSDFRFYKKEKVSGSWYLLEGSSANVNTKIRKDLRNYLIRHPKNEDVKGTKPQEERKVVNEKAIEANLMKQETARDVNQNDIDDASSHKSDGEGDDKSDEEENNSPRNLEDDSLSDETAQKEEEKEEGIGENKTNEKCNEERLSVKTSNDELSGSDESDDDDNDDSSTSSSGSSRSFTSSKNSKSADSDGEEENENDSSTKSHVPEKNTDDDDDDGGTTRSDDEKENGRNDVGTFPNSGEKKSTSRSSSLTQLEPTHVISQSQREDGDSESNSDDDGRNNSSDSSSDSSSDVSSTSSSSASSTSDDDSSSSSSASSDSSDTKKKIGTKPPKVIHMNVTQNNGSSPEELEQRPVNVGGKRKKRKPLLDPKKPLIFT